MINYATTKATIKREILNRPERMFLIFVSLFLINLVFLGYAGVYKGFTKYRAKRQLVSELETINEGVTTNINRAQFLKPYLGTPSVVNIRTAVPEETGLNDFIPQFVFAASSNGYAIKIIDFADLEDGIIEMRVLLEGDLALFPELISEIENMPRMVSISEISITNNTSSISGVGKTARVSLRAYLYYVDAEGAETSSEDVLDVTALPLE